MDRLKARLLALEAKSPSTTRPRLSVLVLDSPTAAQEVAAWRAKGFEAVIDGPDDPWREAFIG